MNNIFVANKIRVGFQNRSGCFTNRLAYVIYYDEKGKIRKEKSWEAWRNKDIPPEEYENIPTEGFTINKDIKRYTGEWFSSTRTMIRIHDPRGFEFEVTTENLIGILMHTDCLRRGLIGQFVYAWAGTDLVLLPVTSEEYTKALKYTAGLSQKVSAKNLKVGASYKTKRDGDVVYMGKLDWYSYNFEASDREKYTHRMSHEKTHIFTDDDGETFFSKNSVNFLSSANTEESVLNFAELMDKFNKNKKSKKIAHIKMVPVSFNPELDKYNNLSNRSYFEKSLDGTFEFIYIYCYSGKYHVDYHEAFIALPKDTSETLAYKLNRRNYNNFYSRNNVITKEEVEKKNLYHICLIFEDGTSTIIKDMYSLTY